MLSHLIFLQHHEVEMLYAFVCIVSHSLFEGCRTDHFTDILVYKGVPEKQGVIGKLRMRSNAVNSLM